MFKYFQVFGNRRGFVNSKLTRKASDICYQGLLITLAAFMTGTVFFLKNFQKFFVYHQLLKKLSFIYIFKCLFVITFHQMTTLIFSFYSSFNDFDSAKKDPFRLNTKASDQR